MRRNRSTINCIERAEMTCWGKYVPDTKKQKGIPIVDSRYTYIFMLERKSINHNVSIAYK